MASEHCVTAPTKTLKCDMERACEAPVSTIDCKGYVYCERHGVQRKAVMRCRKLTPAEAKQLAEGRPLARY